MPQLRVSNTGYSGLILPTGEIVDESAYGVRQRVSVLVPILRPPKTLLMSWGDWFGPTSLALGAVGLALFRRR